MGYSGETDARLKAWDIHSRRFWQGHMHLFRHAERTKACPRKLILYWHTFQFSASSMSQLSVSVWTDWTSSRILTWDSCWRSAQTVKWSSWRKKVIASARWRELTRHLTMCLVANLYTWPKVSKWWLYMPLTMVDWPTFSYIDTWADQS